MKKKFLTICLALFLVLSSLRFPEVRANTLSGSIKSTDGREIPITVDYPGGYENMAKVILDTITQSLPILENLWGVPYIYKSIRAETFNEGPVSGMIATAYNNVGMLSFNLHPVARFSRSMVIHELNHSWHYGKTGNDISRGTLDARWFDEASSEANSNLVLKALGAPEEADVVLEKRAILFNLYMMYDVPLTKWGYQSGNTPQEVAKTLFGYSKGTFFMMRLYDVVGTDVMRKVWKRVFEETPLKTEEFTRIVEEEYGEDLKWLWSGWLYGKEYEDPWWIEWRENIPREAQKLRHEKDNIKEKIADDGFGLVKIEKDLDKVDELFVMIKVNEAKEALTSIESDLAKVSEFVTLYTELKSTSEKNKDILETYGADLTIKKRTDTIKSLFNNGRYEDAKTELESLLSDIKNLSEAVVSAKKTRQNIKSLVESNKKDFEQEGLSLAPMEEKLSRLEETFNAQDFSRVSSLSEEIKTMMTQAKDAFSAYREARDANSKKGFLGTDSSDLISEAKKEFNAGNYAKCEELSGQAQEKNKKTNMTSVAMMLLAVVIAMAGGFYLFKVRKSRSEVIIETKEKQTGETTPAPVANDATQKEEEKREPEVEKGVNSIEPAGEGREPH